MTKRTKAVVCMLSACVMTFYTDSSVSGAVAEPMPAMKQEEMSGTAQGQEVVELISWDVLEVTKQQADARREAAETAAQEAAEAAEREAEEAAAREAAEMAAREAEESAREAELLAALIYCEAGGEPYEGQVAVGAVVMNRVKSERFPNSVREVIYQGGQFGPAITGKLDRVLAGGSTTDSCRQAAEEAIAGTSPVGEAVYFGDGQNFGTKIGGHWFHL